MNTYVILVFLLIHHAWIGKGKYLSSPPVLFLEKSKLPIKSETLVSSTISSHFDWRLSVAGGLAGGIASGLLLPLDTLKTMRQADPAIKSIQQALKKLQMKGFSGIYSGLLPAVFGSIPSSALYFGSYETMKSFLYYHQETLRISRPLIHMLAAIGGNIASSFIFVPKDVIKQQLQAFRTDSVIWSGINRNVKSLTTLDVVHEIFSKRGFRGFYPSYRATLLRNMPGAALRFTIYEELKLLTSKLAGDSSPWSGLQVDFIPFLRLISIDIHDHFDLDFYCWWCSEWALIGVDYSNRCREDSLGYRSHSEWNSSIASAQKHCAH